MRKADTTIKYVEPGSIAEEIGLEPGDKLLRINGSDFHDILEYRYLMSEYEITLEIETKDGNLVTVDVENNYEDIGVEFAEGLIDKAQSCSNKCIFCFIDQLPKGMRDTVYFKDDDTRLSFLQGNYVTLTNMSDEELERLVKMHVSPINISVHATEPELRKKMLNNRFAGKCFDIMRNFAKHEICMNCQIVLCPGINDGDHLRRTLYDLASLFPYVNSVSVVPVGLTRYREGLCKLKPFNSEMSRRVIEQVSAYQAEFKKKYNTRLVYLSDEFYINAGIKEPPAQAYEGFPQLENGVGLVASMREEFESAVKMIKPKPRSRRVICATGELAAGFISGLAREITQAASGVEIDVRAIRNDFFGGGVNVAGLVCGCDIVKQLKNVKKADAIVIPQSMLRDSDEIFLDDMSVGDVESALGMKLVPAENDGYDFVEKVLGEELEF